VPFDGSTSTEKASEGTSIAAPFLEDEVPSRLGASLWAPMSPVRRRSRAEILGSARSRYATLSEHAMGRTPHAQPLGTRRP